MCLEQRSPFSRSGSRNLCQIGPEEIREKVNVERERRRALDELKQISAIRDPDQFLGPRALNLAVHYSETLQL